ncbi:LLM class flavin-dependent oxidoreductase [Mycobacterium sp. ACS4331]|uniref:LLM class flavin-dependent oxidoreductase n=1 Tax=Mycobacterium sp. ACS4331 TaxID=1834121 RepID=UPI000802171C|nr:LLM class flavin-dependent oxidoreductase [Mycobacterium sp. ACS4331]OBF27404.1 hypothetical protein A5727_26035 [Mycobacterium sp. ACS4331]
MRYGAYLPNMMHIPVLTQPWEWNLTAADVVRVLRLAEGLGFDCGVVPEHFLVPTAHIESTGDHYFDATTAQAFLAGATTRIKLLSSVTILPLHHPVVIAKAIATLDWFSNGRSIVGVGVGWLKDEFDLLRVPFDIRGRMADEYLAAMFTTNDPRAKPGRDAQQIIDNCSHLKELGVTVTSVLPPPLPDCEAYLDFLRRLAADVLPAVA